MKRNIFEKIELHEVFKQESVLYPDFLPDKLPFREKEIDELVFCLKPLASGRKPLSALVLGRTGLGKTVSVKHVLGQLEDFTDKAKGLYINCYEFNSRYAVFFALLSALGRVVPRRGLAVDELYTALLEVMKKTDFVPVIVLDEFDQLLQNDEGQAVLYDLLRLPEQAGKGKLALIVLSNDFEIMSKLEDRVKSSFGAQEIIFNPYTPIQLKQILRERSDLAFQKNALDDEVINVSAAHAGKLGGDCRVAIECLLKAGRIAEKKNSSKVKIEHLQEAFELVQQTQGKKALAFLDAEEKIILRILLEKSPIPSSELYEKFNSLSEKTFTPRTIRNFLYSLEKKQVISLDQEKGLNKTLQISLKINNDTVQQFFSQK
ncbi:MAG: AAA family ATPase [Candidatus Diapherotrites archaeon]|nr:AAA family ATPase [Candidatus Diapherotrites archaeon]